MINVGIIGAGHFGEKHAEAIAALPNVRVVAANRTNEAALAAFIARFGGRPYTSYEALLADHDVDAVVIATPHHLHTEIALQAARAGKHILLEKPIAPTLEECDQIVAAVREHGITFMASHTNHFVPVYQEAKAILDSGELGELVLGVDKTAKRWWAPNRRGWHLDRDLGGGIWMTIATHNVDRLTWFVGSPVQSVSAQLGTRFHDQRADDVGMAFLRYENGVAGTVYVTGYQTGVSTFEMELIGTKGMLKVDMLRGLYVGRDEKWKHIPLAREVDGETWMEEALVREWQAFVEAVETGGESPVSVEFARHIMATIFAAETSSAQQREVRIQPLATSLQAGN